MRTSSILESHLLSSRDWRTLRRNMSLRRSLNASERGIGAVFTGRDEKGTCDCWFEACCGVEVVIDVSKDQKEEDEA